MKKLLILTMFLTACAGPKGKNGTNGLAGNNGSTIQSVQFCPGTGVYPSVFPEVGLLIDGHLYAVYSANGGFLFEVLPGTYASNAIGNSCAFTVNPDLSITN
jgi:hypothetical protein